MHSAPSVTYPVGRCRFAAGLYAVLWLVAAAVVAAWAAQSQAPGARHAAGAAVVALLGAALGFSWWRSPRGELAWDGALWHWRGRPGAPAVRADLQRWLLVEWRGAAGGRAWLWLEEGRAADRWAALRRAVYSPARTEAARAPQAPLAGP